MQIYGQEIFKIHFCVQGLSSLRLNKVNPTPIPVESNTNVSLCFSNLKSNFITDLGNSMAKKFKTLHLSNIYNHSSVKWFSFKVTRKKYKEKLGRKIKNKFCFFESIGQYF